jgi:hypothetical protein
MWWKKEVNMPACDGCKTKKISWIATHTNEDGITTGFEINPCNELGWNKKDMVKAERLAYCIKRYHKGIR